MLEAIQWIERLLADKTVEQYMDEYPTRAFVERQVSIISEASVRLGKTAEALCPQIPWRNVRGIGNHIRHAYDSIDPIILWKAVTEDIPLLRTAVEAVLAAD